MTGMLSFFLLACQAVVSVEATVHDDDSDALDTGIDTIGWAAPTCDIEALPDGVRTVEIEIDPAAMARLDADPWGGVDERGVFIDGDGAAHEVDLSYRGAYALLNVMSSHDLRNWKVKFDAPRRGSREWNLNYEPHFRQKLALDLFRFAGLAVPGAEHVVLLLNGEYQGTYLEYEDPDSAGWLQAQFGRDDGDLYKAAYDLPYEPQCFADLTWLGDSDADYVCHYTNKRGEPDDFGSLRAFLDDLNHLPDDALAAWVEESVDVDRLLSYLVVSNFIANWDSYPQRPKNYWLYADPRSGRMIYIPWDLDGTFSADTDDTFNQMGATASIGYNLLESEYVPVHESEGTQRPLVRRLLGIPAYEQAYLERYAELSRSILSDGYLSDRLRALSDILEPHADSSDRQRIAESGASVRAFV
ncbi:MAG: spore coat protein CotH, partial [Myxococcota bacterium]